jgi:hypothetical protein
MQQNFFHSIGYPRLARARLGVTVSAPLDENACQ